MPAKKMIDWAEEIKPLLEKYKGKKHPLNYRNTYELIVVVILSSQDSDKHINEIAPALFKAYPSIKDLAKAKAIDVQIFLKSVRSGFKKTDWIMDFAKTIQADDKIPKTMDDLKALHGIGRKSANIIIRETGGYAEGIVVDIHVLRVVPRIGIAEGTDPKKIESKLMETIPQSDWNDIGMAFSFLGRDICRPTDPKCPECPVNRVCAYYVSEKKNIKK